MAPTSLAAAEAAGRSLRIAVVGHVDHGKSTIVGRMLHDADALPEGKVDAVAEMCRRRGMPFEWAFVTDALQAERDQGVTIDASHIRFRTPRRRFTLIDAPGHREFIKNMISGAAGCDGALVVIDAQEGVRDQSRRHGYLLHLLGVGQIVTAVTKMDAVGYDPDRFADVEWEYRRTLAALGVETSAVVPVSGREGDNLVQASRTMTWYRGPTLVAALEALYPAPFAEDRPLRIPVQDVYRFDSRRIVAGRVESGRIRVGDTVLFSPSNHVVKVRSLEGWASETPIIEAAAGQPVGITLDDQVFVERGEIISHVDEAPIETNVLRARLFWLGAEPLAVGERYTLKLNTTEAPATVERIERVVDTARLAEVPPHEVPRDAVADVVLRTPRILALDPSSANPRTGRFVLGRGYDIGGGGLIDMEGYPDQRRLITRRATNLTAVEHRVSAAMRAERNRHAGGVLWLTGLSGAGKSTLAVELERLLFRRGYQVFVLDGDNLRHGLNANLGFSPDDRAENIRRAGEVAALFAEAGFLVVTAFISPYRTDRDRARAAAGERFHEIYVKADLATCESRDIKGLYRRARAGEIPDFTGISAPYEAPERCELVVDTNAASVSESLEVLLAHVERHFPLAGT